MKEKMRFRLSTTQIILLGFAAAVLCGSLLLSLPISSKSGEPIPYIDALFTAATSTCVTGLVTVSTASVWSAFGQAVILVLIQIGGIGVVTVMISFMLMLNRRIGMNDRLLIQDAFNLNTLSGLVRFVKKVLLGTLIVEGVGAALYMTVFVPKFGARGIWISVFNAVSAFCNAGMDIIGENSLCDYAADSVVNFTTAALVIIGGLGYIVWWDILRVLRMKRDGRYKLFASLTLHSKIALCSTAFLIVAGALLIFCFEYGNPETIGDMSVWGKIQASIFQSVTTRTAGFATVPQEKLTNASAIVSMLLMTVGGSPVGTAGGIKTVTAAVLIYEALSVIKGKSEASLFSRTISKHSVVKAVAVVVTFLTVVFCSTVLLAASTNADGLDLMYETVSAAATVGLSRNLTPSLGFAGKLIIIFTMYFGRVGPISLAVALGRKASDRNIVKEPSEEISIG